MKYYTDERNIQMLISLMKAHGIRRVIASPGTTNITLVGSLQHDPYFQLYSSVDERSAAYMACGMAAESGEPVALSCTGATASRNYVPGLTEAYYRKLPVLAITSTQHIGRVGQNIPQVIDRSSPMPDIAKCSVHIPTIQSAEDEWAYNVLINKALLELRRDGGGPVHINLTTTYSPNFQVKELPQERVICRCSDLSQAPAMPAGRIALFVGAHLAWNPRLTQLVEHFCAQYNAVVLCDHTSNYTGQYAVYPSLLVSQELMFVPLRKIDLLIDMGNISGAYLRLKPAQVWRVSPDGEVRDTFRQLRYVFECAEETFFAQYTQAENNSAAANTYWQEWQSALQDLRSKIPDLPFSNPWLAQQTLHRLPAQCRLHLGILNSLRSWNLFEKDNSILAFCNTGGFGIDGNVSSLIGAALADPQKLFFGVVGDLAFFYDLNAIGNRHVTANLRILLVNNGKGTEFRNYNHSGNAFGDAANDYIAAAGHYGNQSPQLVKQYAQALGFQYFAAKNKEEYLLHLDEFVSPQKIDRPILFEVFTDSEQESDALRILYRLEVEKRVETLQTAKKVVKNVMGEKGVAALRKMIQG